MDVRGRIRDCCTKQRWQSRIKFGRWCADCRHASCVGCGSCYRIPTGIYGPIQHRGSNQSRHSSSGLRKSLGIWVGVHDPGRNVLFWVARKTCSPTPGCDRISTPTRTRSATGGAAHGEALSRPLLRNNGRLPLRPLFSRLQIVDVIGPLSLSSPNCLLHVRTPPIGAAPAKIPALHDDKMRMPAAANWLRSLTR